MLLPTSATTSSYYKPLSNHRFEAAERTRVNQIGYERSSQTEIPSRLGWG